MLKQLMTTLILLVLYTKRQSSNLSESVWDDFKNGGDRFMMISH
jgi:hypothetical protein